MKTAEELFKEYFGSKPELPYSLDAVEFAKFYASQPAVSEGEIDKTIERIEDMNPYKESGNRDSYSEYNEGWSDACDVLGQAIKELLNVNVLRNISLNVQGEAQQRYEKAIEAAGMYLLEHMEEDIDYALFARHVAKIAAGLKEGGER